MNSHKKISLFKKKIEINYWLWVLIAIPWGICGLFQPYFHPNAGPDVVSDYSYIKDWVHNYVIDGEFIGVVFSALIRAFSLPFVVGFLAQFLIMFLLRVVQRKLNSAS